ncbi:MAG: haloacid dehalogenase type II [Desulfuromonadales bacterium]|nr:haloacid dehalogenase type II [Desulfuromonadales bacterium]
MAVTLAFDVYGTLIDTHGVVLELEKLVGDRAPDFSRCWREKQLEYSFRRGLMQNYQSFAVCTKDALDYTCEFFRADISPAQKDHLLEAYRVLPAFDDVEEGLQRAKKSGFRMFAFSNGSPEAVTMLLVAAGIRDLFDGVVSVDEIKSFKPNPAVYSHFLRRSGSTGSEAWMISSNPFDVIGAVSAGMRAAWVRRSVEMIYDPWGIEPTLTVPGLEELAEQISSYREER